MRAKSKRAFPPHGNTVYPWPLWEDGQVHEARKGKHFHIDTETFRKSLASRASTRGLRVTTRVQGDTVVFQFRAKESN